MIGSPHSPPREDAPKTETVYGDGSSLCDGVSVDSGEGSPLHGSQTVISEKVRALANNVYREFESLIDTYGRDVVSNLMPLVVACLENLDRLYSEKTDLEIDIDLLKEDNNQLISQFEKERQTRKATEEKILHIEDRHEDYKNEMAGKLESLETNIKMMEMKSKSAQDHVTRLEEKEAETKREITRLHERYNDLLRSHMEALERAKANASVADADSLSVGSPSVGRLHIHQNHFHHRQPHNASQPSEEKLKDTSSSRIEVEESGDYDVEEDDLGESLEHEMTAMSSDGEPNGNWEQTGDDLGTFEPDSAMFEEMTMPDEADVQSDEGPDCLDDQDYESEFGMSREIDNLIKENMELVETKNALNIVKDDLITQLDDLTGENEMMRFEVDRLSTIKSRLKNRIRELEVELKSTKSELDKAKEKIEELGEEDEEAAESDAILSQAHRRRFTRGEMVRLLTERNQYKERLMELQDAVRWTEMMRAKRDHPELVADNGAGSTSGRRGMWKYFSGLFGGAGEDQSASDSTPSPQTPSLTVINANATTTTSTPAPKPSKSKDGSRPRRTSSSGGSFSTANNVLSALANFIAPSASAGVAVNPLFTTPPPTTTRPLAIGGTSSASSGSSSESPQVGLGAATIPKLVTHDVRLLPAPRGPGSAVKRVDGANTQQKR